MTDFQGLDKVYTGTFRLGATTPSYDSETEIEQEFPYQHITPELVHAASLQFVGDIQQVPPMFSAIKVDGQPLYKKARKGEMMEIQPRSVHIFSFEITAIELPEVSFRLHCSKGTYVRSVAHDMGQELGCGAYLTALRRENVGAFSIQQAWDIEALMDELEEMDEMPS
ncbi:MAG: hypothetical protein R2795_14480 [Saprospiraceae bacterium]